MAASWNICYLLNILSIYHCVLLPTEGSGLALAPMLCLSAVAGDNTLIDARRIPSPQSPLSSWDLRPGPNVDPSNGQVPRGVSGLICGQLSSSCCTGL